MKLNIAILSGGNSSEREIALQSAANIAAAIDRNKYRVATIDVHGSDWKGRIETSQQDWPFDKNDFSMTVDGEKIRFDYAFIMIHGTPGEDGKLQGYLEMMGIPFSSCGSVSSMITFDKITCKRTVASTGVHLAKEVLLLPGDRIDPEDLVRRLGLPFFVKPNASGSSFGVTKVKRIEDIVPAIENAFRESDAVLAEEFLAGREFGCGVMVAGGKEYRLPVTEIVPKNEFFDYQAKYTAGYSEEITPAPIPEEWTIRIQEYAIAAYKACRCRGIVRVDFIVTDDGTPYLIEINSIPGMSNGSIVPKQIAAAGISVRELIDILIEDTLCNRQ